jgi:hypothetical protein
VISRRLALACLLGGCAITSMPPVDAGSDAGPSDVGIDAYAPDTHCDVRPVPSTIPTLMAVFDENDGTPGHTPPMMTGGDPVGVWVFDHGTFWVDPTANAMFNRFASNVTGTAWIAIDATDFRLDYELVSMLAGTQIGTIDQHSLVRAHARWRLDHEQIEPTGLVCNESDPPPVGDPGRMTFTRVDATHLTLETEVPQSTGTLVIVLEGTLAN